MLYSPYEQRLTQNHDVGRIPRLGGTPGRTLGVRRLRANRDDWRNAGILHDPGQHHRRAHGSDFKIEVDGSIRYPDAFVLCSQPPRGSTVTNQPVVVFEILSPSTSRIDRIVKAREYGNTASIVRYVILEPAAIAATIFTHTAGVWAATVVEGAVVLDMPEIGITLPLAELYQDVEFPSDDEAAA